MYRYTTNASACSPSTHETSNSAFARRVHSAWTCSLTAGGIFFPSFEMSWPFADDPIDISSALSESSAANPDQNRHRPRQPKRCFVGVTGPNCSNGLRGQVICRIEERRALVKHLRPTLACFACHLPLWPIERPSPPSNPQSPVETAPNMAPWIQTQLATELRRHNHRRSAGIFALRVRRDSNPQPSHP